MIRFDPSQQLVLELSTAHHARVLGAPGSGKTALLIESFVRATSEHDLADDAVLVLASNRLAAAHLRSALQRRLDRALGGTPVRTATSLAFAVLTRSAALHAVTPPRLLTGTVHDELITEVLASGSPAAEQLQRLFAPEVLQSPTFRAELRELARVVDDFATAATTLRAAIERTRDEAARAAVSRGPSNELAEHWVAALEVVHEVELLTRRLRPNELSASGLIKAAATVLLRDDDIAVPSLILVDDAQELGEGELGLLAACVSRGSRVWVFGDPDIATGAFQGEHTDMLTRLQDELARKGVEFSAADADAEQAVTLQFVHRHERDIRAIVAATTARIGAAGAGGQRQATTAEQAPASADLDHPSRSEPATRASAVPAVQFATVATLSEQLGVIAHRLRRRKLGLDTGVPIPWGRMAVICRSQSEAVRASRVLAGLQVPSSLASGGMVLREHRVVRELIRLLQHALGIQPIQPTELFEILGGTLGTLDQIALRRLRGGVRLHEQREAREEERSPRSVEEVIAEEFASPGPIPIIDSSGGRALRRLAMLARQATQVCTEGGTPRETLWALWDGAKLAKKWQDEALSGRGLRADEAHRSLDAVLGLFFVLQRHEEQASEQPISEVLDDLLTSAVPEDTLAAQSARERVTISTPQGVIGREFDIVCILGPQDGIWPNLRTRGSLLGVTALERWLRGGEAHPPSRRETLHDELRLFAHACARARHELLAVAVRDEDHHPSSFFGLGSGSYEVSHLPSSRLTIRGAVAEMRRRLTLDPDDAEARDSLVALANESAVGAAPDDWYGIMPPSTTQPLVDLAGDADARVRVSPSQLENAERCPLDWAISRLGGGSTSVTSSLGTLLHHALEHADGHDAALLLAAVMREWDELPFEAVWESARTQKLAELMTQGLADYLNDFEQSGRELLGREVKFEVGIGRADLAGVADRLEAVTGADGTLEVSVVDLKTGKTRPSERQRMEHAQMQAYQLGVICGAFTIDGGATLEAAANGGARLLYVHPDAVPAKQRAADGHGFVEAGQAPLTGEAEQEFRRRVSTIADVMAAAQFTARVEHHCSQAFTQGGACRLHVIPAVSHA